ncbi:MAG: hypothetical protein ACRD2I_22385 [Vicinamibacterales bacterium]
MTDEALRAMIRDSIARHAGVPDQGRSPRAPDPVLAFSAHVSHLRLPVVRGAEDDGACIIEPAVRCNHCGFCISYGH